MRIRITRLPSDIGRLKRDDIDLSWYAPGEAYEVGPTVGTYLVVMGWAESELNSGEPGRPPFSAERGIGAPASDRAGVRGRAPVNQDQDQRLGSGRSRVSVVRSTVLLVDDVLDQLDMYEMALEESYRVLRASRGHEAFDLACRASPDVIVLDVRMPDLNGVTLCQKLRSTPATAAIPILLLTAYASPEVKEHAKHAGATQVLSKPCPGDKLRVAINDVLSRTGR